MQGLLGNDEIMEDKMSVGVYNRDRWCVFSSQLHDGQEHYGI